MNGILLRFAVTLTGLAMVSPPAIAEGRKFFIGVGVNKYESDKIEGSNYAESDVIEAALLFSECGYQVTVLTASADPYADPKTAPVRTDPKSVPTKANINASLTAALARCEKGDTVVVAFVGAGRLHVDDPGAYFCPKDGKPAKEQRDTLISLADIYKRLDGCAAGGKVLLADCHWAGADPVRDKRAGAILTEAPPKGVAVLFGGGRNEKSLEYAEMKHGVFFHHVLEALRGTGIIGFEALVTLVRREVPITVKRLAKDGTGQTPVLLGDGGGVTLVTAEDAGVRKDWEDFRKHPSPQISESLTPVAKVRFMAWRAAAERGSAMAMVLVSRCYKAGASVVKDEKEEARWLAKGAELGNTWAVLNFGLCMEEGVGVPKDVKEATRLYTQAAEAGNAVAMFTLGLNHDQGVGFPKDEKIAAKWYARSAALGYRSAMVNLGQCYLYGTGLPKNLKEALRWLVKSAELNETTGMITLGWCYETGTGVPTNAKMAAKWYRKAAEASDSTAMGNLGTMYENGTGVDRDPKVAVQWYTKGADLGDSRSMYCLGNCYLIGTGTTRNQKLAVKWFTKAAEQDYPYALLALGTCYEKGTGVPKDIAKAIEWYRKAAKAGNTDAEANLKRLTKE